MREDRLAAHTVRVAPARHEVLRQDQRIVIVALARQQRRGGVDALGQQPRDLQQPVGMGAQHLDGVVDDEEVHLGDGADGGGLRRVEQHAHLADHRAGRLDGGDMLAVAQRPRVRRP